MTQTPEHHRSVLVLVFILGLWLGAVVMGKCINAGWKKRIDNCNAALDRCLSERR